MAYVAGGRLRRASPAGPAEGSPARSAEEREIPSFWMSRFEVTWREFDRFLEYPEEERQDGVTRPSRGKDYLGLSGLPPDFLDPERPATGLRYHSAMAYCEWLSRKTGLAFRLPTETEWEFACRGGSKGAPSGSPGDFAWYRDNSEDRTHPVGRKRPNPLGIHDMLGNVWEYCLESYRPPNFEPVLRGGAWNSPVGELELGYRQVAPADWSLADPNRPFSVWWFRDDFSQGFRVVRVRTGASPAERKEYARSIRILDLRGREHSVKVGNSTASFVRVTGRVENRGNRPLVELALKVYPLDPAGRPHLEDRIAGQTRRATWNVSYPVLAASAHEGEILRPLDPGEGRTFEVDVPSSFDGPENADPGRFGAEVLHLGLGAR